MAIVIRGEAASFRRKPIALFVALALPALAAQAQAQQGETQLGDVTVTAPAAPPAYTVERPSSPKFTAPLLETPKSVTIIPREIIDERGAASLADVLRTTPGISLGSGEGGTPMGDRPFIRGYEASTDIFIDGVRDLGRFAHEAFNIEQIEVVKGPGSAYSGRGSTGGSINLASKKPRNENFLHGSLGLGTDKYGRATADVNRVLAPGVAARLNVMKHKSDVAGRDEVDQDRWGIAPSVTFGVGGPTRATLSYYGLRADDVPDLGHPFDAGLAGAQGRPANVDRDNFYGVVGRDKRSNDADVGTIDLEHDVSGDLKLRNVTRWSQTTSKYIMSRPTIHAASGQVNRAWRAGNKRNEALVNQTDLTGKLRLGQFDNDFAVGLEFSREKLSDGGTGITTEVPRADLHNPDPRIPYSGTTIGDFDSNYELANKTNTRALYAFNTTKLHEQWDLNLGLRYDHYEVTDGDVGRTDAMWNYQLGVVYKPLPNGSVYLAYGTSSNPSGEFTGSSGGADGAAGGGLGGNRANLDPEKNRSLELGTKWELLDRRLALTAALFQTEKTNQRAGDPLTGDVELIGDNRTRGFELGVSGNLTPAWALFGGYTYLDPKLKDDGAGSNDGNRLKYIAKNSLSLWSTYKVTSSLTLGGGATYMSKRWMNDANTLQLPSYWRYDAMAAYTINRNIDIRLNVLNLSDKTIYDGSHVGLFANVAPGRSAIATVNFKY